MLWLSMLIAAFGTVGFAGLIALAFVVLMLLAILLG